MIEVLFFLLLIFFIISFLKSFLFLFLFNFVILLLMNEICNFFFVNVLFCELLGVDKVVFLMLVEYMLGGLVVMFFFCDFFFWMFCIS